MRQALKSAKAVNLCNRFLATALLCALPIASQAQPKENNDGAPKVEAGTLTCTTKGGGSFIFGTSKDLKCTFHKLVGSADEYYEGVVTKFGIDLGVTGKTVIIWKVLAPTRDTEPGALSGTYEGVSADASLMTGAGINFLAGGSEQAISLQPVSVQVQDGVNVALGISSLDLRKSLKKAGL